jgi:hypothetical protein
VPIQRKPRYEGRFLTAGESEAVEDQEANSAYSPFIALEARFVDLYGLR